MAPSVRGEVSSLQHHHHKSYPHHQGEQSSEEPRPGFVKLATSQFEKNIYKSDPSSPLNMLSTPPVSSFPIIGDSSHMEDESAVPPVGDDSTSCANKSAPSLHNGTQQSNNSSSSERQKSPSDDHQNSLAVSEPEAHYFSATFNGHQQANRLLR